MTELAEAERAKVYPWITRGPVRRQLKGPNWREGGRTFLDEPCPCCGYAPIGFRVKCPACFAPRPEATA